MMRRLYAIVFIVSILLLSGSRHAFAQNNQDDQTDINAVVNDADKDWDALVSRGNVKSADDLIDADQVENNSAKAAPAPVEQAPAAAAPGAQQTAAPQQQAAPLPQIIPPSAAEKPILGINFAKNAATANPDLYKEHQIEFGSENSFIEYQEPSLKVRDKGPYFGIFGSFEERPPEARDWFVNVVHIDAHMDIGDVNYKSPDGQLPRIYDYMFEPRIWLGSDIPLFNQTRVTPYFGWGYRLLYDHFGEYAYEGGYNRVSQYFYLPAGIEMLTDAIPGWEIGFTPEYDIFIGGWQESYLSNVNSVFPDLNNKQAGGYGYKLSLEFIKKMKYMDLVLSPYVRYWHIHQSETAIAALNNNSGFGIEGYEPENKSVEVGLKVGLKF